MTGAVPAAAAAPRSSASVIGRNSAVGFNFFNRRVRQSIANSDALAHIVLAQLKGNDESAIMSDGKKGAAKPSESK